MIRENKFGQELGELLEFQNISLTEYAERIGTTPKNLIDIIEGRISLSFNVICNIAFISDISVNYICNVEENYKLDKKIENYLNEQDMTIKQYINKFHYKELKDKYDVSYNNELNDYSIARGILKYLRITDPKQLYKDNNHIFYKSQNDKPELLALWLERCNRVVSDEQVGDYESKNIDSLVEFINNEAKNKRFNKERLIKEFNKNGIYLAIEDALSSTKVRGAFKVSNNKPYIFITTMHKRIADIYFALLHELGHCKSDFNRAKNGSLISYIDEKPNDEIELNADKKALNWMVDDKEYNRLIKESNYKYSNMCFLVYRLALDKIIGYESNLYQVNNPLI